MNSPGFPSLAGHRLESCRQQRIELERAQLVRCVLQILQVRVSGGLVIGEAHRVVGRTGVRDVVIAPLILAAGEVAPALERSLGQRWQRVRAHGHVRYRVREERREEYALIRSHLLRDLRHEILRRRVAGGHARAPTAPPRGRQERETRCCCRRSQTFTPTTRPSAVTAGPPLMPGLIAPAKWILGYSVYGRKPLYVPSTMLSPRSCGCPSA